MEMSITRGLAELKLLDSRIRRAMSNTKFVASNKKSAKNVGGMMTKEEFNKLAVADYTSILDLIERRKQLKSAIVESNAKTEVIISECVYTVADAIERKNNIEYEKTLLNIMRSQVNSAKVDMITKNNAVDANLDRMLETMLGKDNVKASDKDTNVISIQYREDNEYEILDPLNIEKKIRELETEIENFESEVDYVLSESNTITKIVIAD
jgi:hypothetical protein